MHFPRPLGFSSRSSACGTDEAASRLSHVMKRQKAATDEEACWAIRWALLEEEMLITALSACAESSYGFESQNAESSLPFTH